MAKQPTEKVLTKKHLARLERERQQQRFLVIGAIVVVILVVAVLIYGILDQTVIKSQRPVAKVGNQNITTTAFQKEVRFQRSQTIQQLQTYMSDPFIMQIYGSYITQMAGELQQPTSMGQTVLDKMVEDEVVAQEAKKLGITVSQAEVDKAFQEAFGYYANGTSTPTATGTPWNTPTLTSQQQTLVPPTAIATATPDVTATAAATATGTPPTPTAAATSTPNVTATATTVPTITPTPTPYTKQGFETQVSKFTGNLKAINYSESDLRELIRKQVLRQKVMDAVTKDVAASQDEVWARHILVANEADAKKVEDLLKNGGNFAELAKQYSTDTSNKDQGGDLGWFPKDQMVKEFSDAAFAMKVGEISQPVKTTYGYHIIQVLGHEKRPLDPQQLQSAKQTAYQTWLDNAKKELKVQTYDTTWTSAVPTDPAIPAALQSQLDQLNALQQQQQQQQQQQLLPTGAATAGAELVTPAPTAAK